MNQPELFYKDRATIAETPLWSEKENALYWVDIRAPAIKRYNPRTKEFKKWTAPGDIGAINWAKGGRLICAVRQGWFLFDPKTGQFDLVANPEPGKPHLRMNDSKVDRAGRLWSGSMKDPDFAPQGSLFRLDPDHSFKCFIQGGITIPNALCFSPDDKTMYFADSPTRRIMAYAFDKARGEIANPRLFAEVPQGQGVPDGATVDSEGFVWSAHMMGGRLTRYDPAGKIERVVQCPTARIASCALGGPGWKTLYIATGTNNMTAEQLASDPLAGSILAIEAPAAGLPEPEYGG